jgi:hypothetical protein
MTNTPTVPPTNDVLFQVLTRVIWEGRCIVVLGAGVSAADYPLWTDLIAILQERCGLRAEDLLSTDPLDVAQAAKDKDPQEYARTLDEGFSRKGRPLSATRYRLLARIKFASYINLNLDPLLLDILDEHFDITVSEYPHLQNQHHGSRELFYMHGRLGPDRPLRRLFGSVPTAVRFDGLEMVGKGFKARLSDGFGTSVTEPLARARLVGTLAWTLVRHLPAFRRYQELDLFIGTKRWASHSPS